ncbi:LysR family transcriptional regulator [Gordonia sp. TBRC 11910]|uniref:LysR family transcriptional regulator n=1 Tax=Gordonia asplenii TaxID=2725283 RepID=A0A848KP09_9ACTN|nr:LysR substrate-binding domain-containing protein [Gordonia asplenii]NMO00416.1 LysR family transcriptional regulator [Gordonia asplenii]
MELSDIRAFLAVAEELHFGRAAARLHMAQPPLSRTIKQLERKLGATLFNRNTRSVQLTSAGASLVAPARDVLAAVHRAEAAVSAAAGAEVGEVRIAFAGLSTHMLVAELARAVRAEHPGVHLELSSQNFAQPAMKKVAIGDTDLALGRWDIVPAEIATDVVMSDSLVVALPDTHRFACEPQVSIGLLSDDGFVSLPLHEGAIMPDRLLRLAQVNGFVPNIIQIAPDTQTALALVSAEVGAHLTLASVARNVREPHVSFVPLADDAPDVDLRAAWRRNDANPALRAVLEALFALKR